MSGSINGRNGADARHAPTTGASVGDGRARPVPVNDPSAEREARWKAREARRGSVSERPAAMTPSRRRRRPVEAPLMRGVASAGIVGIAVAIAAIMSSKGSSGWLIGLVVSIVSLALATVLRSSRRH